MLPSLYGSELGSPGLRFSRPNLRSLSLRPDDLLTILKDGFVDRHQKFDFSPLCYPSYKASDYYFGGSMVPRIRAHLNLGPASEPHHLRLIAFVQGSSRVALSYLPFLVLGALLERFLFSKMVSGTLLALAFVRTLGPRIEQLTPA